jgi:hypothetical protein
VVTEPWRGYAGQREYALRLPTLRHDWVFFVDADEWVCPELATDVAQAVAQPEHDAYAHRFRLVFQGRWIRHCGWYQGSWLVRLMRRSTARFGDESFGERVIIDGSVGRLPHDVVDENRKGLAFWLRKHVGYAELEAMRPAAAQSWPARWSAFHRRRRTDTRPLARAIAKDLLLPLVPARPLAMFCYMYVCQRGFLDGVAGLRFCLYHAWFQLTINSLRAEASRVNTRTEQLPVPAARPSVPVGGGR